jgi:hypothetical protein
MLQDRILPAGMEVFTLHSLLLLFPGEAFIHPGANPKGKI